MKRNITITHCPPGNAEGSDLYFSYNPTRRKYDPNDPMSIFYEFPDRPICETTYADSIEDDYSEDSYP